VTEGSTVAVAISYGTDVRSNEVFQPCGATEQEGAPLGLAIDLDLDVQLDKSLIKALSMPAVQ
jgi:hypothetical protein